MRILLLVLLLTACDFPTAPPCVPWTGQPIVLRAGEVYCIVAVTP